MHGDQAPSEWVTRWATLAAHGGRVLDVASGGGRHARWFAARGHPSTRWTATRKRLRRSRPYPASMPYAPTSNAVHGLSRPAPMPVFVVANYLHRPLFPDSARRARARRRPHLRDVSRRATSATAGRRTRISCCSRENCSRSCGDGCESSPTRTLLSKSRARRASSASARHREPVLGVVESPV